MHSNIQATHSFNHAAGFSHNSKLSWYGCCFLLQDQLPAGADEQRKWPWFKALKWVLHNTYRIFNRCVEIFRSTSVHQPF